MMHRKSQTNSPIHYVVRLPKNETIFGFSRCIPSGLHSLSLGESEIGREKASRRLRDLVETKARELRLRNAQSLKPNFSRTLSRVSHATIEPPSFTAMLAVIRFDIL